MDKGKGEGGGREMGKEESVPYRSRLISLQLDEHMFRGPGEFAENSLIRLFDIRRASPKPRPSTKETANDVPTTIGQVRMGEGGFPQIHPRSFFDLTAFAYGRRDMRMDEAVRAGELTRGVTMPSIAVALSPYAFGVFGSASLYAGPSVAAAGTAGGRYMLTQGWRWYAAGMTSAGTPFWQKAFNDWFVPIMFDVFGDGSPGGYDLAEGLVLDYCEMHTPPPRVYTTPELWSEPRVRKTRLFLPPTTEEVEEFRKILKKITLNNPIDKIEGNQ